MSLYRLEVLLKLNKNYQKYISKNKIDKELYVTFIFIFIIF